MKKVLITGASGFIGSGVLKYFLRRTNWEFTCTASFRHHGNPKNMPKDKRVKVVTLDLTGNIPDLGKFDYILHLASESHVDRSIAEPVSFIENNVSITLQVLEYARKYPPKVFLLFSTDEVYGAKNHEEWDVLYTYNPYSASKGCEELIAFSYWASYGVPVVITNSNNIVGPNQHQEKFVPKLINLISEGKVVEIHTLNGKPGRRYYNPVNNVADALLFILGLKPIMHPDGDKPDKYSLNGGKEFDNLEMAQFIASLVGKELKYQLVNAMDVRPAYDEFYPETDGKLKELGWKPPLTFEEGMEWVKQT